MIVKCPSCGSTDLNFETRTCRNCGDSIDATLPMAMEPAEREEAALLQDVEDAAEAMEVAATEDEKRVAYETWEERVFQYYDKGFRIVTLIGRASCRERV